MVDILGLRLQNQHLTGEQFDTPEDAVSYLGAIQSQDFAAAKWSLGQRVKNATDETIEEEYNEGKILRTHVMRPTWHFISPKDLLWMQKLTSPQVKKLMGHYNRKLELTDEVFKKTNRLIEHSLKGNNYLTRQELKTKLLELGIMTDVQRLAHIIMWAELDGIICSGPKKGKQFTYALVSERIKKSLNFSREKSLSRLATKYFQSHAPAQLKDFAWWSGLSIKDAIEAIDSIKSQLHSEEINGKIYWFTKQKIDKPKLQTFLLSIFDEYTISYKDRSDLSEKNDIERMISMGNALTAVVIINGKVAGTWKRKLLTKGVAITINPFRKLLLHEEKAVKAEKEKYAKFLQLKLI